MLPKLFSNIILAVIAIFVLYTFAPLIREIFGGIFGTQNNKKKKSVSDSDFEEMVKRKQEQLSSTGRIPSQMGKTKETKTNRSEWDYLEEKGYFDSEDSATYFKDLKKSLDWGLDQSSQKTLTKISKDIGIEISEATFMKALKKALTKKFILENFDKQTLNPQNFQKKLSLICLDDYLGDEENFENYMKSLSRKLLLDYDAIPLLIQTVIYNGKEDLIVSEIEEYIENQTTNLEHQNFSKFIQSHKVKDIQDFEKLLKKQIDIILPLVPLDEKNAKVEFFSDTSDKDLLKKKYKKIVSLYHPDKWNYYYKTDSIDKRLRENFNIIQKSYDIISK